MAKMINLLRIQVLALMLINSIMCTSSWAMTYFVDYVGGSDSNAGTSKAAAWKRAPRMTGFTGGYVHSVGDRFIFKGGVTWPAVAFPLIITDSGASGSRDYYGVDMAWYSGGSWTRPIFDFQDTSIAGYYPVKFQSSNYVDFDSIEVKNMLVPATSGSGYGYGSITTDVFSSNIVIKNCKVYNWIPLSSTDSDFGGLFLDGTNITAEGNIIGPGRPKTGTSGASGCCIRNGTIIKNNDLTQCSDMYIGSASEISGNTFHDSADPYDPINHPNGIWHNAPGSGSTTYIYNNKLYNLGSKYQNMLLHPTWNGNINTTYYIYNNVYWGVPAINLDRSNITSNNNTHIYVLNNTCSNGSGYCAGFNDRAESYNFYYVEFTNNHWITDSWIGNGICYTSTYSGCGTAVNLVLQNNITQTTSNATASGYTLANMYKPLLPSSTTVDHGISKSSIFNADILGTSRPQGAAWDIGAYEFIGKTPKAVEQIRIN